jgi:Papain family cysteine protease
LKKILSWVWFPALLLAFFGITAYFIWRGKQPTRRGLEIKKEMYDSVPVFARLDTVAAKPVLPIQVSLEAFCPTRQNQGEQNSCVGWSIAYAARTIIEAKATGSDPNSVAFSPAFLFNQIRLFGCAGSYMPQAFRQVTDKGLVAFDEFPYSDADCDKQPTTEQLQRAERYKIAGFSRLTKSKTDFTLDTLGMKQCLAGGTPVVIGAVITASFDSLNTKVWLPPTGADESLGGHAMCVVGYNDTLAGGAFQIMNSWGETWGDRGFGWVRYRDFMGFCKEAYSLQPLPTTEKQHELHLKLRWVVQKNEYNIQILNKNKQFLPTLIAKRNKNGTPKSAIPNLQLEAENKSNFYFYLVGQRKNSVKAQVIYPADKQETAYLGIFGKRLFPREKPLNINFRQTPFEQIVALHSKFPLQIDSVCESVNKTRKGNLTARLTTLFGNKMFPNLTTKIVKNALEINTDSSAYSIALVPFTMPTEPLLPIPTLKNALKKPIDSLVVRCANIKIGRKNVSFDITARTSNHPDWNGYLNNLDVVLATDANIVGYDLATRSKATVGTAFAQAKYTVNLTDLERGTMLIRLSPKTKLRTFLERKTRTLARITIPIENCSPDLKQTGLRLSLMQSGGSATATYGITPENNANTKLKFRKFGFRDVVVKMRCE